jgi:hypothetical protein
MESEGFVKAGERLVEPAQLHQGDSEVVVELDPVWVQVEGPAKVRDRFVVAAKGSADAAEIGPELGIAGLGFDGLAVQSLGVVEGAEAMEAGCEGWNIGSRDHTQRPARTFLSSGQQLERHSGDKRHSGDTISNSAAVAQWTVAVSRASISLLVAAGHLEPIPRHAS